MTAHLLQEDVEEDLGEGVSTLLRVLYSKQGRGWIPLCCKEGFLGGTLLSATLFVITQVSVDKQAWYLGACDEISVEAHIFCAGKLNVEVYYSLFHSLASRGANA